MQLNKYKKIMAFVFIAPFLFGLLAFFYQSFAQAPPPGNNLLLVADKTYVVHVGSVKITGTNGTTSPGGGIIFSVSSSNDSISPQECSIISNNTGGSCSVTFIFANSGTYVISATLSLETASYPSNNNVTIIVGDCPNKNDKLVNGKCEPETTLPPNQTPGTTDTKYSPLAPFPGTGLTDTIDTAAPCAFGNYLNIMIKIVIGFSAVLAMVMIVMGGIEYMTSSIVSGKEAGKQTIINALLGLLVALGAYVILNTINPNLLNACLNLGTVSIIIDPQETLRNRAGGGVCEPIADSNNPCSPGNLSSVFSGTSTKAAPFDTIAAQASAICNLESRGVPNTESGVDKCSDGKAFSFGLFQINGSAHRNSISACSGAFSIPAGHGQNQGNRIENSYSWTCTTNEPEYTKCKEYLKDPANNIKEAYKLYQARPSWDNWTTRASCIGKF